MKRPETDAYRCFRRVQEFLAAHPFADAPANLGRQASELDAVVSQLSQDALDQEAGHRLTKAETKHQKGLRAALWDRQMLPIARVAREVFGKSGVDKALTMPKKAVKHEAVINAARAMAEAAAQQSAVFVEHGLSNDFVAQLNQAANDLDTALKSRDTTRRRRLTATAGVAQQLKRGRRAVRLLNAILQPRLAQDPELLSAWESVRRVKSAPSFATVAGVETTQTPTDKAA